MKISKNDYYMELAKITAKRSSCVCKQVGLVMVDEYDRVVMISYNGVPKGQPHCNETFTEEELIDEKYRDAHHKWSIYHELHAEENLIAYCAKYRISTDKTTVYITVSPCISCARMLLVAGIKKVIYLEEYNKYTNGIEFLQTNGIECEQFKSG